MIVVTTHEQLVKALRPWRESAHQTVGFVPTMGFLHEGHTSLIELARQETDCVVVSIFVNPTQFGPDEDFDSYPRNEDRDFELCRKFGADIVFLPDTKELYPLETQTYVSVKGLTDSLCGQYRPGHFVGVTTVVAKLFNLVQPHVAFFGQKDAQQVLVIQRMVTELLFPITIRIGPTVREPDGLAMSSRNVRLTSQGRAVAPLIYKGLSKAVDLAQHGELDIVKLVEGARNVICQSQKLEIQYLECRDQISLQPMTKLDRPALLATAVFLDGVRLIDNVFLNPLE